MTRMLRNESIYSYGLLSAEDNDPNGSRICLDRLAFRTEVRTQGGV
jgi:hypothetical protein